MRSCINTGNFVAIIFASMKGVSSASGRGLELWIMDQRDRFDRRAGHALRSGQGQPSKSIPKFRTPVSVVVYVKPTPPTAFICFPPAMSHLVDPHSMLKSLNHQFLLQKVRVHAVPFYS